MKITVAGAGYVGMANAVLLSQRHEVYAVDLDSNKVDMINNRRSPVQDPEIQEYLAEKDLKLTATTDGVSVFRESDYVVISTPTDYDPDRDCFDTSSVDAVIRTVISCAPDAVIVIKSTIPSGYTKRKLREYPGANILFSPEFLREGRALLDNLYPSRIIVGVPEGRTDLVPAAKVFAEILRESALKEDVPVLLINSTEAEAVKLFSNTYLALRVSFFNELDTYAETKGLDAKQIIEGVCLDPRIGSYYNNPSFGYGGYCLPKDTRQLLSSCQGVPQKIMRAVVEANTIRKAFVAE
ncbi:MAG: nucleotide sugar dehydrogenase, partial [Lachnospiraceae bacterium]|nr:nucleotide sugar dehydrogenase [Lachnospiraceae bacterium]